MRIRKEVKNQNGVYVFAPDGFFSFRDEKRGEMKMNAMGESLITNQDES